MFPFKKNPPEWKKQELIDELNIFLKIYPNRPIKTNDGGMMFPHMFSVFFILRKLQPEFIIESGIFRGQSTWLIENSLPNAKILSIDINLDQRKYISKKAEYSNLDFKYHNFIIITRIFKTFMYLSRFLPHIFSRDFLCHITNINMNDYYIIF